MIFRNALLRVVIPHEPASPAIARVILARHVREMTDLPAAERDAMMQVVWCVESVMREVMAPDKVNLSSLGNMVSHLHWHVVGRWRDDAFFPASIWSPAHDSEVARQAAAMRNTAVTTQLAQFAVALADQLASRFGAPADGR